MKKRLDILVNEMVRSRLDGISMNQVRNIRQMKL